MKPFKNGIAAFLVDQLPEDIPVSGVVPTDDDIRHVVEIVPERKPARYGEDVWDFTPCFRYNTGERSRIDFTRCLPETRDTVKDIALAALENGSKISSIISVIQSMNRHLRDIVREASSLELITAGHVIGYIRSLRCTPRTKQSYLTGLLAFFVRAWEKGLTPLVDTGEIEKEKERQHETAKHVKTDSHPPIPEDYLCELMGFFDRTMRDETLPLQQRLTAGMALIDTQLGLRATEIVILPRDCVRTGMTSRGERKYIVYPCKKAARAYDEEVVMCEHVGTPLLYVTLDYYLTLRERSPRAGEEYLYVDCTDNPYPIKTCCYRRRYRELFRLHYPQAARPVERIIPTHFKNDNREWSIPDIHSYRVNVFSAMASQGVPYPFIEKMMSHSPQAYCDSAYYTGIKAENNVWDDLDLQDNDINEFLKED